MTELAFTVYGKPQPAGSKRAFAIRRGGVPTGQVAVSDANPKAKSWQAEVRWAAVDAMLHRPHNQPASDAELQAAQGDPLPLSGPLAVWMVFYAQRPKGHFGTGKNADKLKPSAPPFPIVKPDSLKLARGTEDAMTGIVYRDDAQVVNLTIAKRYGLPERCEIVVRVAEDESPQLASDVASGYAGTLPN